MLNIVAETYKSYRQINREDVKKSLGYPISELNISYKELATRLNLHFEETTDDEDKVKIAFIEIKSGRQFVLYTYPEYPDYSSKVLVYGVIDNPGTGEELKDLLSALKLDESFIGWHRDWKLDLEEFKVKWRLWRQDDNGNRMVIGIFPTEEEAEKKRVELDNKGHKQLYWVDKTGWL